MIAITKGPNRHTGHETFHISTREPFTLASGNLVLYFLQRLAGRDPSLCRRQPSPRWAQALGKSALDEITGVGARRKKSFLHYFGSARVVAEAGLADLENVMGISRALAKKVYDHFHARG